MKETGSGMGGRLSALLPVVIAFALCAGCKPTVRSFRVNPNVACKGSAVRLTWDATSGGELSVAGGEALGRVDAAGAKSVTPTTRTRYHLDAKNLWGMDSRDVDVNVISTPASTTLAGSVDLPSVRCEGGALSVVIDAPPTSWDPHVRAATVSIAPHIDRHYHVEHGGVSAELDPGASTVVFAALPVQGAWAVTTPLQPGEACGQRVPRNLLLDVFSACYPR